MRRGRFISFEGGDGAGKTTQVFHLSTALRKLGIDAITTREPGGSEGAEDIRQLLVSGRLERWDSITEALLHTAARRDHLMQVIEPALANGQWVICDRFADSTLAYQGYGLGANLQSLQRITDIALDNFTPDLTFMLDISPDVGLRRTEVRADDTSRYELMDKSVHERIRKGFLCIAKDSPDRCEVIDASFDPAVVRLEIQNIVSKYFGVQFDF